jgi:hypothetical protein
VDRRVGAVHDPQFFAVRGHTDAVAWAAVSLDRAFLNAGHFNALKHLSRFHIAYLEPQEVIDVDKAE